MEDLGINTLTFPSIAKPHFSLVLPLIPRETGWNTNRHRFFLALTFLKQQQKPPSYDECVSLASPHFIFYTQTSSSTPLYNYWPCICFIPLLSESLLPSIHSARAVPAQGTNGFQAPSPRSLSILWCCGHYICFSKFFFSSADLRNNILVFLNTLWQILLFLHLTPKCESFSRFIFQYSAFSASKNSWFQ